MGYLLKEALKILCGINQWSYAVFWKFGCQNPKLLIWEECYYEPASCYGRPGISGNGISEIPYQDHGPTFVSTETLNLRPGASEGNKMHLLVKKMMEDNHVNVVGEGLVGRVAFSGNHQWILSENYYRENYSPEVLKEVCLQFSAGVQTVVVVPVLPHGVAQFGSCSTISENIGFVDGVVSLIHELGCVPGVLQSSNQEANELAPEVGFSVYHGYSAQESPLDSFLINPSSSIADSLNYAGCSAQTSAFDSHIPFSLAGEFQNEMQPRIAAFRFPNSSSFHLKPYDLQEEAKTSQANKSDFSFTNQFMNGLAHAEVIPSSSFARMNRYSPPNIPRSAEELYFSSCSTSAHARVRCTEGRILSDNVSEGNFMKPAPAEIQVFDVKPDSSLVSSCDEDAVRFPSVEADELRQVIPSNIKPVPCTASETVTPLHPTLSKVEMSFSDSVDHPGTDSLLAYISGANDIHMNKKVAQSDLSRYEEETIPLTVHHGKLKVAEAVTGLVGDDRMLETGDRCRPVNSGNDNSCFESQSGDDLFDILGADFKDKWLRNCWRSCLSDESAKIMPNCVANDSSSKSNRASSEIYHPSQRKSGNKISSFTGTNHLLESVVSKARPCAKKSLDNSISCSTILNNTSGASAPTALLPHGRFGVSGNMKRDLLCMPKSTAKAGIICSSLLSTASLKEDSGIYSEGSSIYDPWIERGPHTRQGNNEPSKTIRKRLKQGESPRPRPKDRQMIQDRVKELREIVPNGAKCSIDALLEHTIKHMLFLQSVSKHADKLKQAAESKIISKDGGLLLKDNPGGATWAYDVGSQSMVCPIIVEDLNQPHQMLVEMLCEERGLFLEIADIIRGLGLTILKGLMETRNEKIWAHFAVEANRKVTRMEIFLSLVSLLEQNVKTDAPQTSSNKGMVQEVHQAASLPTSDEFLSDSIC